MIRAPILAAATLLVAMSAEAPAQLEAVVTTEGRVAINFPDLSGLGLEVTEIVSTAPTGTNAEEAMEGPLVGFKMTSDSNLRVLKDEDTGNFVPYGVLDGGARVEGGFTVTSPSTGRSVDFHGFTMHAAEARTDGPGGEPDPNYFYISSSEDSRDFILYCVKIFISADGTYPGEGSFEHLTDTLNIKAWDMVITPELARKLDRPDLIGELFAYGKMDSVVVQSPDDWELPEGQNINSPNTGDGGDGYAAGSFLDVALGILNTMKQMSGGHVGSFPNGRAGLSMSTTSCNFGNVNVPWEAPNFVLQENHPGIAMQLYREMGGRFEQVGTSWIKHGFFALSNSQCIPCQNPSNGTFLGVGCSDTYATSNNADRQYLGPRDEWNPHTGTWECNGSYFDGAPADCLRSVDGSEVPNGVDHRLEAFDSDLDNDNATYLYEAYYIVNGDQSLDNNIGSRRTTMNWTGASWVFQTATSGNPLVNSPAIERWADADMMTREDFGADDGRVILGVNTTDLGNGQWRYEYALFNWTLDRRVRSFSVPNVGNASDFYFHDIDNNAANDWVVSTAGKNVTWTFPDVFLSGHKVAGPLEFCNVVNFGFTSNHAPGVRDAVIRTHDAGPGAVLKAIETLGPAVLALSASDVGPADGTSTNLEVRGGTVGALVAAIGVSGVPIPEPVVLTPAAVPFVGGFASIPLALPAGLTGLEFDLIAADVDTSVIRLSNLSTIAVH